MLNTFRVLIFTVTVMYYFRVDLSLPQKTFVDNLTLTSSRIHGRPAVRAMQNELTLGSQISVKKERKKR